MCLFPGCTMTSTAGQHYCPRHAGYAHDAHFTADSHTKCVDCDNWVFGVDDSGVCPACRAAYGEMTTILRDLCGGLKVAALSEPSHPLAKFMTQAADVAEQRWAVYRNN